MSTAIKNYSSGGFSASGHLSNDRTDDGLLKIHGVALGDNDITVGSKSKKAKLWKPEVLEGGASYLKGKDIVVDHDNESAYKKVGEVTDSAYKEGIGIIYQGVMEDEDLESKVERGWLDVSPRVVHTEGEQINDRISAPGEIRGIDNLSIVREGASESNELNVGEHEDLSVEELQDAFDYGEEAGEYHASASEEEIEELRESIDFSRWMYEDREGAEGASESFPCEGTHAREVEGVTRYMPCSSPDDFLKALEDMNPDQFENYEGFGLNGSLTVEELSDDEKRRIAGQISSWSALTRDEAFDVLAALNPETDDRFDAFVTAISRSFDVDEDDVERVLDDLDIEEDDDGSILFGSFSEELSFDADREKYMSGDEWDSFWSNREVDDELSDVTQDTVEEMQIALHEMVYWTNVYEESDCVGSGECFDELSEDSGDLRTAAAVVADRWDISTGDALQIIDSITPGEGGDLRILAGRIAERDDFDGVTPADVLSALDDLRGGEESAEEAKKKYKELKRLLT